MNPSCTLKIDTIDPIFDTDVERKSSINQHRGLLSVMKRGEVCPIIFDSIDSIDCGRIKSHKIAIRIGEGLDYTFPVKTCKYVKDTYFLTHKDKIELKPLPEYYGTGFYEAHTRQNVIINLGKSALGHRQEKLLRVGLDYCRAKDTLEPVA